MIGNPKRQDFQTRGDQTFGFPRYAQNVGFLWVRGPQMSRFPGQGVPNINMPKVKGLEGQDF